jgi:T5orf172 domain
MLHMNAFKWTPSIYILQFRSDHENKNNVFKIGRTLRPEERFSEFNQDVVICALFKVNNDRLVERLIFDRLKETDNVYWLRGQNRGNECFCGPYKLIYDVVIQFVEEDQEIFRIPTPKRRFSEEMVTMLDFSSKMVSSLVQLQEENLYLKSEIETLKKQKQEETLLLNFDIEKLKQQKADDRKVELLFIDGDDELITHDEEAIEDHPAVAFAEIPWLLERCKCACDGGYLFKSSSGPTFSFFWAKTRIGFVSQTIIPLSDLFDDFTNWAKLLGFDNCSSNLIQFSKNLNSILKFRSFRKRINHKQFSCISLQSPESVLLMLEKNKN